MKKSLILLVIVLITARLLAHVEPNAGTPKTWFITSAKDYRLTAPAPYKNEVAEVIDRQKNLDSASWQQIEY